MFGLDSIIQSLLPADFDMEASIAQFKNAMNACVEIRDTVQRVEQKLDSEIVTLRERVALLESPAGIVQPNEGVSNDDRSIDHGEGTGRCHASRERSLSD